ncbi:glycoside hydrolase family protein [Vibrio coralliilyticus]|uniref:glycoside hydrolase family protein n=1 Tax=Vibrio TaxID=662 RepID=UPI00050296E7|nr:MULTISPECIES: glycoside hydrolase family protein [Vibrio]KFI10739.1 hypothetical protein IX95_18005 [Vibrio sp. B183]NOI20019.1 glycoside hydrolase family protein [Vibrio coralliilyticus]
MSETNPNFDVMRAYISENEGYRPTVYKDTQKNETIGIGYNLNQDGAKDTIEALGVNYQDLCDGAVSLTNTQINTLFEQSITTAIEGARQTVSNFSEIDPTRQIVVVDMVFNMGQPSFAGFKEMIAAVESSKWEEAAKQMQDSLWYKQVGERGVRDVQSMQQGALVPMPNRLS